MQEEEEEEEEEDPFEFRTRNREPLPAGCGQSYPLTLEWFMRQFPDLLETIQHDISIDFERSKNELTVFTAQHYSQSKNWNLAVRSVKDRDLAEAQEMLEKELPELLRTWVSDTIRDAKLYTLRYLWIKCSANRFEFGNLDEK